MWLTSFDIRNEKGEENVVLDPLTDSHIVGIYEAWMRPGVVNTARIFQECAITAPTHEMQIGYGGVSLSVNTSIKYELVYKHAEKTC